MMPTSQLSTVANTRLKTGRQKPRPQTVGASIADPSVSTRTQAPVPPAEQGIHQRNVGQRPQDARRLSNEEAEVCCDQESAVICVQACACLGAASLGAYGMYEGYKSGKMLNQYQDLAHGIPLDSEASSGHTGEIMANSVAQGIIRTVQGGGIGCLVGSVTACTGCVTEKVVRFIAKCFLRSDSIGDPIVGDPIVVMDTDLLISNALRLLEAYGFLKSESDPNGLTDFENQFFSYITGEWQTRNDYDRYLAIQAILSEGDIISLCTETNSMQAFFTTVKDTLKEQCGTLTQKIRTATRMASAVNMLVKDFCPRPEDLKVETFLDEAKFKDYCHGLTAYLNLKVRPDMISFGSSHKACVELQTKLKELQKNLNDYNDFRDISERYASILEMLNKELFTIGDDINTEQEAALSVTRISLQKLQNSAMETRL